MTTLEQTLHALSPRYAPPRTPVASVLIHLAVAAAWLALMVRAVVPDGVFAWSAGLVYVLYDTALLVFTFWGTLPLLRVPTTATGGHRPDVAVIVAMHNEAAALPRTLHALLTQNDPPELILLADDGSTDSTPQVLAQACGMAAPAIGGSVQAGRVRWLRLAHQGKAGAMNTALPLVSAEVVMTVDADTILHRGAVAEMRRAFAADAGLVAATGIMVPVCAPSGLGPVLGWFQRHEYLRNFLSRYAWARQGGLLLISGAFAGFRRAPMLEVGGFDPDCLVEDYELIHRLRRFGALHGRGWSTAVLGRAQAVTDAPASIGGFLQQRRRWFGGFLQTQYWYRDMVGNGQFGRLGTRMLPVKAADTLQPVYGLSALALLVFYLATGHWRVLLPVLSVIGAKIVFDLAFYLWSVRLYRRWVGSSQGIGFGSALLAAIVEPFSFQVLRHIGAMMGWHAALAGRMGWGRSE